VRGRTFGPIDRALGRVTSVISGVPAELPQRHHRKPPSRSTREMMPGESSKWLDDRGCREIGKSENFRIWPNIHLDAIGD
jgi:hypothetical protein